MSGETSQSAESDQIVRAEIGTRSPDGEYAVVRYYTAGGRMFRRTRTWVRALADVSTPPASEVRDADYMTARPRPTDAERAAIMRAVEATKARRVFPPGSPTDGGA